MLATVLQYGGMVARRGMMTQVRIDQAALRSVERQAKERFEGGVNVPLDGSEEAAVRDVAAQCAKLGVTPNLPEIRKQVRRIRRS